MFFFKKMQNLDIFEIPCNLHLKIGTGGTKNFALGILFYRPTFFEFFCGTNFSVWAFRVAPILAILGSVYLKCNYYFRCYDMYAMLCSHWCSTGRHPFAKWVHSLFDTHISYTWKKNHSTFGLFLNEICQLLCSIAGLNASSWPGIHLPHQDYILEFHHSNYTN